VLRKKAGDIFEAGILGGLMGTGKIEKINLDGSIFVFFNVTQQPLPKLPIRVLAGLVRPIQVKRLLRDLSSMGVAAIDLVGTDLGEKSYHDTKLFGSGGSHKALIEGAVQSRDTIIPPLSVYKRLDTCLKDRPWDTDFEKRSPLLLAMDNVRPEGSLLRLSPTSNPVVLAIGSERGWSDRERELLENAGFLRLSLGDRALRTETACVAATAVIMEKIC
jgi:RsmE family RNA methyltransferase